MVKLTSQTPSDIESRGSIRMKFFESLGKKELIKVKFISTLEFISI